MRLWVPSTESQLFQRIFLRTVETCTSPTCTERGRPSSAPPNNSAHTIKMSTQIIKKFTESKNGGRNTVLIGLFRLMLHRTQGRNKSGAAQEQTQHLRHSANLRVVLFAYMCIPPAKFHLPLLALENRE